MKSEIAVEEAPARPARLRSLDVLRGFDMLWILGADALVYALGRMSDTPPVRFLVGQLTHKDWAGFAFYDLIFPLFVFIVGVSCVFSLSRIVNETSRSQALRRILLRAALLFAFGVFYNGGLSREFGDVRWVGVLQRIAVAYAVTGILFCYFKPRILGATAGLLLVGYWALLTFVPIRDIRLDRKTMEERFPPPAAEAEAPPALVAPARKYSPPIEKVRQAYAATDVYVRGKYEPGYNVANHFDFLYLPGGKYDKYWDPEGVLSTLPAVATCLLGAFAGLMLRRPDWTQARKLQWLAGCGALCLLVGYLWGLEHPVIKKIWTSSFVLVAGGWSFLLLAGFYYLVDIKGWQRGTAAFVWIGMNPITLYLLTSVVNFTGLARRFSGGSIHGFFEQIGKGCGDLVTALVSLGLIILIARWLYHRGIFLKV